MIPKKKRRESKKVPLRFAMVSLSYYGYGVYILYLRMRSLENNAEMRFVEATPNPPNYYPGRFMNDSSQ